MTTINNLSGISTIADDDLLPMYSVANSDARKITIEQLKEHVNSAIPISDITGLQDELNAKQDTLVSGSNIKTVNGLSLVGSGNAVVTSDLVPFTPAGTGAVATDVQTKLREIVSVQEYLTKAEAFAASGKKLVSDTSTGQLWGTTDSAPLNYQNTRAGFVWQHRDAGNAATNELVPGIVFQFNATGNGTVNSGSELSLSIWLGQYNAMTKSGDGSGHCYTSIGQLGAVGPGGYNELGMYQGEMTNIGSVLGTMSGVEVLLKDSPDSGVTSYSTKMQGVVSRVAKYHPTSRKSHNFYASCEGGFALNSILAINPSGLKTWSDGLDLTDGIFTSGRVLRCPNNSALSWQDSLGAPQFILGVSSINVTYLRPASAASLLDLQDFGGVSRFQVFTGGINFANATLSAGATAGTNGAPPAQVGGYFVVKINGSDVKLPYYNM